MKVAPLEFEKPLIELEKMIDEVRSHADTHSVDIEKEVKRLEERLQAKREEIYNNLTPWQRVQIVRHPKRPYTLDYLKVIASDFTELNGDRMFGNDKALVGGFATIGGEQVLVMGHQKGRDTKENLLRNFGLAHPEGYRKALRLMKLADRFGLPIISFIDTAGAYPGVTSEERHISEAIAVNLREMFHLRVPIIAVVLGEGGSGGALGVGIADRVLILENGYYSVISPEACAAILWRDRSYAPQAAAALKMTAPDLKTMGLVDEVLPEPPGGAQHDWEATALTVQAAVLRHLKELRKLPTDKLLDGRYERFRAYGAFTETEEPAAV
jgi:acetyl-CoA carboxylase carboxyl transferase subunit alpha